MILASSGRDLTDARARVVEGQARASALIEHSFEAAASPACQAVFLRLFDATARAQAGAVDRLHSAGAPLPPLAGLAVSIKDLFDVANQPTTGGSTVLAGAGPAPVDCTAVARLRQAGAALCGHTNLSEFAFSGVGINPHHGTPANPATSALDREARIPGGSTSGGAVSVATGAAWAALGSDTGGSLRIPAALQGLVGFKPTQALTPLDGTIPLSPSMDTVGAITHSVRDAVLLHEVLAARRVRHFPRPLAQWRLALPTTLLLDGLDDEVARTFAQAIARLRAFGARIDEIPLRELGELAALNAQGGFAAAESWAWHRARLTTEGDRYDPRVAARMRRGAAMSAADYIDLRQARQDWMARVQSAVEPYDALLAPTVPMIAPPLAPLIADDEAFFAANARLLRNPSAINFLDGCAISLPCHSPGGWPVGLMAFSVAGQDDRLLSIALAIELALESGR